MSDTFGSVPAEIPDDLIDQLLAEQPLTGAGITGPDGLLKQLTKRLVERAMGAELSDHLGYEEGERPPVEQPNRRNGSSSKTLITEQGAVPIEILGIAPARSSRRSCPSTSGVLTALTRRSSRSMAGG